MSVGVLERTREALPITEPRMGSADNPYYSTGELEHFSEQMMRPGGVLAEKTFEQDLQSAGDPDLTRVAKTIERAFDAQTTTALALQSIALGKGVAGQKDPDIFHELRVENNRHSKTLSAGIGYLFDLAASELFYVARNRFPDDISPETEAFCMDSAWSIVTYKGRAATYDPDTDEFYGEDGELYQRTAKRSFSDLYTESLAETQRKREGSSDTVLSDSETREMQVRATYDAFRKHFEGLKDEVVLMDEFIIPEEKIAPAKENYFTRMFNKKVPVGEVDFEKFFARQAIAKNAIDEFGDDTKQGIELLETNLGKGLGLRMQAWQKTVQLSRKEQLRNEYVGLKQGPLAQRIGKVVFYNTTCFIIGIGSLQVVAEYSKDADAVLGNGHGLHAIFHYPYEVLASPDYKVLAAIAIAGMMNIIPDKLFGRMLRNVRKDHYGQPQSEPAEIGQSTDGEPPKDRGIALGEQLRLFRDGEEHKAA